MDISESPWLYEKKPNTIIENSGKWMLFYPKNVMNEKWKLAVDLYRNSNKLSGVVSMKCSTKCDNSRATNKKDGIIIFYCNNSEDEQNIKKIGEKILDDMDYKNNTMIFYKTDLQTQEGTRATGSQINYSYRLVNHRYIRKTYPRKKKLKNYPEIDLQKMNEAEFLKESEEIKNQIDKENKSISKYNKLIDEVIIEINKLKNQDDYIIFDNKKYGKVKK